MVLKMDHINPANYNPRTITDPEKKALGFSMEEFGDISGITWNRKTGNLVSGHQRYQGLLDLYHVLTFGELILDKREILTKDGAPTGFDIREVDWPEVKEKAANIAANSHTLSGEWHKEKLDAVLKDLPIETLEDLRLDVLAADEELDSLDWDSDIEKMEKVDEDDSDVPAVIKIFTDKIYKDEILQIINGALDDYDCKVEG